MNETLRELQNRFIHSHSSETVGTQFGMFVEIIQSLTIDGATAADWQEWQQACHDTNAVHSYVARTLYQSSGGVR